MEQFVSQHLIDHSTDLQDRFLTARPFRHIAIDSFLNGSFARSLLGDFPAFDIKKAVNENDEVGGKAVHENISILGPNWQKLDKLVQSEEFRAMISDITGVTDLNFDPDYFGGGTHENLHGQGLNPHVDFNYHPLTGQHRRLNLILYLSPEWDQSWGGSIQLHRDPFQPPAKDEIVTITPVFNRCVIFETNEHSWHGFKKIMLPENRRDLTRKSFALYYYTETRPTEEVGAEHSTIYAEEHLSEYFKPGIKLGVEELQQIRNLLTSRDQHLKRLYSDIRRLNTDLNFLHGKLDRAGTFGNIVPGENDSDELVMLKKHLVYLQRRNREMENSSSWRITRPLRALKQALTGNG